MVICLISYSKFSSASMLDGSRLSSSSLLVNLVQLVLSMVFVSVACCQLLILKVIGLWPELSVVTVVSSN